jgi:hypothetical protein
VAGGRGRRVARLSSVPRQAAKAGRKHRSPGGARPT